MQHDSIPAYNAFRKHRRKHYIRHCSTVHSITIRMSARAHKTVHQHARAHTIEAPHVHLIPRKPTLTSHAFPLAAHLPGPERPLPRLQGKSTQSPSCDQRHSFRLRPSLSGTSVHRTVRTNRAAATHGTRDYGVPFE